jgi:hypothetical protein
MLEVDTWPVLNKPAASERSVTDFKTTRRYAMETIYSIYTFNCASVSAADSVRAT